ncbi:MAG: cyclase family protein [Phycisphaerae bacterium]|jgi:arylformamidase
MIHDITPPITADLKVWPGDVPPRREVQSDMRDGAATTISALRGTVHLGAHADAPSHYGVDAPTIDERSIDLYLGPCQVVGVKVGRGTSIDAEMIQAKIAAPRVLFKTGTYPDPTVFNDDFAGLSPRSVDELAAKGVKLIGIDTPSVDLFDASDLPSHKAVLRHGMGILEGLVLADVPDGVYELIALPLKLVGFDASPVRAILRTMP